MALTFKLVSGFLFLFLFVAPLSTQAQTPDATDESATRHFELTYSGTINDLPKNGKVCVWLPLASSSSAQEIVQISTQLPFVSRETEEPIHGNRMLYFEFDGTGEDELPFRVNYEVRRSEINALESTNSGKLPLSIRTRYMQANRLVPIDGKPLTLLEGIEFPDNQLGSAQELYYRVDDYMTYDKSHPGYGNGDVLWACDSKAGNCTDFHSLFISLARSRLIPSYFEIGFPLPPERGEGSIGGYHCWANFFIDDRGWIPVDISEADKHPEMKEYYFGNLTENRVGLSRGRDINLQPKQNGPSLNYFVYPYVEVDGKTWPKEKINLDFRYRDITSDGNDGVPGSALSDSVPGQGS